MAKAAAALQLAAWADSVRGRIAGIHGVPRPRVRSSAFLKAWTGEQTKKLDASPAAMQQALGQASVGSRRTSTKWECPCGYVNFGLRVKCKTCDEARNGASPNVVGAPAPGGSAAMEVYKVPATAMPPETGLKDVENLIKHLRDLGGNSAGGIVIADLQRQQQGVKEKVL